MKALTSKPAKFVAIAMAAIIVVAALVTGVGKTIAYFTTYAEAKGSQEIILGDSTTVTEKFKDWVKSVTISNDAQPSQPVFVRVKAFSGSTYPLTYIGDANWSKGKDGYYYYALPLNPGESTTKLDVKIEGIPDNPENGDNFNVVVVYESTPVFYDEDGNPKADWNVVLDSGSSTQGGGK